MKTPPLPVRPAFCQSAPEFDRARNRLRTTMSELLKISLPDGSVREMPIGSTPADVAAAIGPGLAKAAIAARVDGELRDLTRPFEGDSQLALVTGRDEADA